MCLRSLCVLIGLTFGSYGYAQNAVFTYSNQDAQIQKNDSNQDHVYVIPIKYMPLESVRSVLSDMFVSAKLSINQWRRCMVVRSTPEMYRQMVHVIRLLDQPLHQIQVEVSIISVSDVYSYEYQSLLSQLTGSVFSSYKSSGDAKLSLMHLLNAMVADGKASVLSQPIISTLDHHQSVIRVGDRIPYVTHTMLAQDTVSNVNYLDTGIELVIRPIIVSGNQLTASVHATYTTLKVWKTFANEQFPILSTREAQTNVNMVSDQTLVIAGLFDSARSKTRTSVPILGDLPVIGGLFQSEKKEKVMSDIIFLITPTILRENGSRVRGGQSSRAIKYYHLRMNG